ncbi:hypothetical protein [Xanthobacter versatilis]|uniref:hypothetical protein n=1 Tax=Xanthobacter autotrophicus (strain ATCC BAA-1158 / Py2) TaxID=78245 RepID=UPI003728B470
MELSKVKLGKVKIGEVKIGEVKIGEVKIGEVEPGLRPATHHCDPPTGARAPSATGRKVDRAACFCPSPARFYP